MHTGIHHTAFEYDSFDDLMSSFARLKQTGIEPENCLNHGVATSLYYSDPDQNMVELQVDNFGNWDASVNGCARPRPSVRTRSECFSTQTAFLPPTRPVRRSSSCKRTLTREYIPLRSRQTYICLRSADFPTVCGLLFVRVGRLILPVPSSTIAIFFLGERPGVLGILGNHIYWRRDMVFDWRNSAECASGNQGCDRRWSTHRRVNWDLYGVGRICRQHYVCLPDPAGSSG